MSRLLRRLFRISKENVAASFRGDPGPSRAVIEEAASWFIEGYDSALRDSRDESLAARLEEIPAQARGFACEGAGTALALLDTLAPWRDRLARFLRGPGAPHTYMTLIGAGWVLARLPLSPERLRARLDPTLGWLTVDGYGFYQGFFCWPESLVRQKVPTRVRGYARRAFDVGLGRGLWFVEGANPERVHATISGFPAGRQGDLWSGTGVACTYGGGADCSALERMRDLAGPHRPQLAQGAAFAAFTRERAGNPAPQTETACQTFWSVSAAEAAGIVLRAGEDLPPDGAEPAFEAWRGRVQQRFRCAGGGWRGAAGGGASGARPESPYPPPAP